MFCDCLRFDERAFGNDEAALILLGFAGKYEVARKFPSTNWPTAYGWNRFL